MYIYISSAPEKWALVLEKWARANHFQGKRKAFVFQDSKAKTIRIPML